MKRVILVAIVGGILVVGILAFTGSLPLGGDTAEGQSGATQGSGFDGISLMGAP